MKFTIMGPGPHVDLEISGTTAVVGGTVAVDCAERQQDHQVVIDIRATNGVLAEGVGQAFVASFVIPPRAYIEVASETEKDDQGQPVMIPQPIALDGNDIEVRLWTFIS